MRLRTVGLWFSAVALPSLGYYLLAALDLARLVHRQAPLLELERRVLGGSSAPEWVAPMMRFGVFNIAMVAVYLSFYAMLLGLPAVLLAKQRREVFFCLRRVWAWLAALGYPLYFLIPARSPYCRLDLYNHPPFELSQRLALAALKDGVAFAYDAFPSLHVAFALAAVLIVTPILSRWARVLAIAWLAALHLATLATGSHYLIDLVAGDLLAGAVWAVARTRNGS